MALIAALIRLTSPGPAVFRQVRVGHRQQPFEMFKFRTMRDHCDDSVHRDFVTRMLRGEDPREVPGAGLYKLADDPRVTPIGALLRRTSFDELPQLVNVVRGEMSLVGPRPVLPWEAELFEKRHLGRFGVKPGITGLWQVEGRNRLTMQEALDLDVQFVSRRSVRLHLWILIRTLPAALLDREAR
jgi:lipopolysaccharide/colanic/teichoic acid biosynthesis glycosyltransferase